MGVAELIALLSIVTTVAGSAWGTFRALDKNLSAMQSEIELIGWRLQHLEQQNATRGEH